MGHGANDDREDDGDNREPSLGWTGDIDQERARHRTTSAVSNSITHRSSPSRALTR